MRVPRELDATEVDCDPVSGLLLESPQRIRADAKIPARLARTSVIKSNSSLHKYPHGTQAHGDKKTESGSMKADGCLLIKSLRTQRSVNGGVGEAESDNMVY